MFDYDLTSSTRLFELFLLSIDWKVRTDSYTF